MSGLSPSWTPSARQQERDAYRQRRARRALLIGAASTIVVLGLVVLGAVSSPGWERTQQTFFDPATGWHVLPSVLRGFVVNVEVFVASGVCILVFGMLLALAKTVRNPVLAPLRIVATVYVDVFRGLPLILVLLLVGFGLPGLRLQGIPTNGVVLGSIALVLTYSAYVAEVFRAGIESVHPAQRAAARSLGLSSAATMRYVVLPQAVRNVVPPLLNDLVALTKDSGLISVIGAAIDAVRAAQIATAETYNFTSYVVTGVVFLCLTIPLTRITDAVSKRHGWTPMGGHR